MSSNTEQPQLTRASDILDDHLKTFTKDGEEISDTLYDLCKCAIKWAQDEAVRLSTNPSPVAPLQQEEGKEEWIKTIQVIHWDSSSPEIRKSPVFASKDEADNYRFIIEHRYDKIEDSEQVRRIN